MFADPLVRRMADFLAAAGIEVRAATLPDGTFLPGLDIRAGAVLVDEARLLYPGDLLHEAGHVAVMEPAARTGPPTGDGGEEMAAQAWSFAAATHLGLDPAIVFHPDGYRGASEALLRSFATEQPIGTPLLQWFGMTVLPRFAADRGLSPYPHMLRWLR